MYFLVNKLLKESQFYIYTSFIRLKKLFLRSYFFTMRFFIFIFFFFSLQVIIAQETYTPTKIQENEVVMDGILSEKIWKNATKIPLDIEFSPANNLQAKKKTTATSPILIHFYLLQFMLRMIQKIFVPLFDQEMILIFGMMILS